MKQDESDLPAADRIFTAGHREAQQRFADPVRAERIVNGMPGTAALSEEQAAFLESLPFFFLATADGHGNVQCSFKGGGPNVLKVENPATLYYPEFPGNDMMLSVGNLLTHPYVGLLGISFDSRRRLRVNGRVNVFEPAACPFDHPWPEARVVVQVRVREVIRNCSRRIPHLIAPTEKPVPAD